MFDLRAFQRFERKELDSIAAPRNGRIREGYPFAIGRPADGQGPLRGSMGREYFPFRTALCGDDINGAFAS